MKISSFFNKKYCFILGISIVYVLFQLIGLDRFTRVWEDETWYANVAYNFSLGNGFVNTNVGAFGGDDLFFFTFVLGIFYKIFGVSLFVSRLVSVIIGLGAIIGLNKILSHLKLINREKTLILFGFIFSNVFYIAFRTVRPDGIVVLLIIWALYFLIKSRSDHKTSNYLLSGFITSLAFLSHPDGGIFGLVFGLYFLFVSINKLCWRPIVFFGLGTLFTFLVLYINIIYIRNQSISEFLSVWMSRSSANIEGSFLQSKLNILSDFYTKYTLGIKRLYILFFELIILIAGLFQFRRNPLIFIISLMGIIASLFHTIIYSRLYTRSFGEIIVFSLVALALFLKQYRDKNRMYVLIFITVLLYLFNNLAGDIYSLTKNYNNTSYSKIEEEIDTVIEDDKKVLSLLCLWFPLKNNEFYSDYTRWSKKDYSNLDALLDANKMEYIVISDIITKTKTQTSGRSIGNNKLNGRLEFYKKVKDHAIKKGKLIKRIPTIGYSTIEIWEIENEGSSEMNTP